MRIRLLILFLSLVLINFTVAQTVKFSDEIKENKYAKYMRTLGADETGNIYVLRSNISLDTDRDRSGFKNTVYFLQ